MNRTLASHLCKFVVVFFDDILIYNANEEEHAQHLQQVLQCLEINQFYVKLSKCHFCQHSIDYLGHIVDERGVHADPRKVDTVLNWPPITTLKQLRGFLGLTGYYRRFIKGYAHTATPLTELLKKDQFK
ncbi:PREDICTED: uncharacterized protein LOC109115086 [Nelumbo nucifera]|uniref:Uncharacterized protein LOC109115086 n=1 Tax=Nelumbo nucifera TaxID=4432 RepID=A0A1U8Q6S3_NELNU|nr:PREDICTED: uncharacterized protein LOC109115086 [Nelumbo nucifera]